MLDWVKSIGTGCVCVCACMGVKRVELRAANGVQSREGRGQFFHVADCL